MNRIPAKPTLYKGIRFRSRLEARWAVFFESILEPWEYEPVVEITAGRYQPDFYIPSRRALIEIKPLIRGSSEPWSLIEEDWSEQTALYEEACGSDRQLYVIFGSPGEWGNGRLIAPGHEAAHFYFTGQLETYFPFQFGECPRCANVWLFKDGFASCCPEWDRGEWLDKGLNAVRDHSYEDGA